MKNMKISLQLFLLVGAMITTFAGLTFLQIRSSTTAIYHERYEMLRTQVETAISVLKDYQSRVEKGQLSLDEAKKQAYGQLNKMTFEPDGYFYGYDYNVVLVFHPTSPSVGQSNKGVKDANGFAYRDELVRLGRAGGGYVEFIGPKPGKDPNDRSYSKASYAKVFEPWQIVIITGLYTDDLKEDIRNSTIKIVGGSALAFLLAIAAAYFIIRGISRPLNAIHDALNAVADEDVTLDIPHTDMGNEVGKMARATKALQEKVRERHTMLARQEEQQRELDAERQRNLDAQRKEAEEQAHVVATIGASLEQLSVGDLTVRCADLGPKYEGLRHNFNDALSRLEQAMSRVNLKGTDISVSKEEIRRASNELAQRTERQAANLEETSAALDELTVAVRQTAEGAREAASRVASVSQEARQSDGIVEQAIAAMSGIEQSATEITKIIGVIDEIAFQTNLLALNAGVEAARAGDSGKGFAVVAQEVRELAQRSAAAAKEIKEQIARSTGQVEQGVQMVGKTGEALKRISSQITAADDIVSKIAHSAQEQDSTLRSISSALNQLDTATQQNAAMAEETTASAEVLANDTGDLLDLIRGFRTNSSASELHRIGHQMRRAG
ncbi:MULTISPECIES: methyl-accepting chemotaxis protein [unclassified Rhizobium]|uniref:methyl-accepting chemotaxis protein n=1 Tax=unclassified Rhizobium TaxID=2613769 RepID=UPI00161DFF22|nr:MULTISPECIES: methyl-accepting chemotaxis protein [unclassified Rhizobium]MDK4718142.1 methyl-accepting chemotaxis protein [Rhizobium sp. CNPSo 3968]